MDVQQQDPVTILDVLDALEERETLNAVQQETLDFLRKNAHIQDREAYQEFSEELAAIGKLKEAHIHRLLDVLPVKAETVRAMFSKKRVHLENDDIDQILDIIDTIRTSAE